MRAYYRGIQRKYRANGVEECRATTRTPGSGHGVHAIPLPGETTRKTIDFITTDPRKP